MPNIIRDGAIIADDFQGRYLTTDEIGEAVPAEDGPVAIVLEPGQPPATLVGQLERLSLIAINFPVFTDGRCFSYARELRELGYAGEIRATGNFIRDQLFYLQRCGFNAFQFESDEQLQQSLPSLQDFSEAYQASVDQPQPLFLRRG